MEKQSAYYQNIYRRYLEYMRISGYKKIRKTIRMCGFDFCIG